MVWIEGQNLRNMNVERVLDKLKIKKQRGWGGWNNLQNWFLYEERFDSFQKHRKMLQKITTINSVVHNK